MSDTATLEAQVEEFVGKVLTDMAGTMAVHLASIGDELGLWKDLAASGPATSTQLADRTSISERYAREWLAGMHAAGYLDYEAKTGIYTLPEHAVPVFAQEGGPAFFGGSLQMLSGMTAARPELVEAFRTGKGVHQTHYNHDTFEGIARFTNGWFQNLLVDVWIPLLPDVERKLTEGCDFADVGTGAAVAIIELAKAFPNSRFTGYDISPTQIELAKRNIDEAGVGDRVTVELLDGSSGLPGEFDVISTFDVVHDSADPAGLLRAIRDSLKDDGRFVCLDMNASHKPEENVGPLHTLFYGCSINYCMSVSLGAGGVGLGTCGFNPAVADEMCKEAGFSSLRRVEMDNPFNQLYEATV